MPRPSPDPETGAQAAPDLFAGLDPPAAPRSDPNRRTAEETISFLMKLREAGFRDTALLRALELVPRERFAPPRLADLARKDYALPLPCGQVMTAPLAVVRMLAALEVRRGQRVLEIGTGSGYVTAILGTLAAEVVSVERFASLAEAARLRVAGLGLAHVRIAQADALAPDFPAGAAVRAEPGFDRILVNGRIAGWPAALLRALRPEGRAVACIGTADTARLVSHDRAAPGEPASQDAGPLSMPPLRPGLALVL